MERRSREFVLKCEQIWPGARIAIRPDSLNEQIGNIGEDVKYEMKDGEGSLFKNERRARRLMLITTAQHASTAPTTPLTAGRNKPRAAFHI
jgi:hypothetical protein